jgi:hypothetical protein
MVLRQCIRLVDAFDNLQVYVNLGDLLDILVLINNGINFILYCSMSKQFRDTFVAVLHLDCFCSSTSTPQLYDSGSCVDKQHRPSAIATTAGLCHATTHVTTTVGNGIMTVTAGNVMAGGADSKRSEFNRLSIPANKMNRIFCDDIE